MKKRSVFLISSISAAFLLSACGSSSTSVSSEESEGAAASAAAASAGSIPETVAFGSYQNERIEWYVLKEEDGKALLLSVHALDARPFNDGPSTWDHSSLRAWLNDAFYQEAFSEEEQQKIQLSELNNGDDLGYGTETGESTEDRVFLLSASEAQNELPHEETVTSPTDYALSQGAYVNEAGNCAWWLRSPGMNDEGPAYYSSQGSIGTRAHQGSEKIIGVRPAVWVDLSAIE